MKGYELLIVVLIAGCTTPVALDIPVGYQPKLVVNSGFSPDSIWTVFLHESVPYADKVDWNEHVVTMAKVAVRGENGFAEELIHVGDGIFKSAMGRRPENDIQYTLDVDATPLQSITATSMAPSVSVAFNSIEEMRSPNGSDPGSYKVSLTLTDRAGSHRYSIQVEQLWPVCRSERGELTERQTSGGATAHRGVSFESSFPALRDILAHVDDVTYPSLLGEPFFHTAYLSDELFDQQSADITLTIEGHNYAVLAPYFRVTVTNWSPELWN